MSRARLPLILAFALPLFGLFASACTVAGSDAGPAAVSERVARVSLTRVAALARGAFWESLRQIDAVQVQPAELGCSGCGCSSS